jgi:3-polyprenyl-4-hydroxybenzoate decarboxylase
LATSYQKRRGKEQRNEVQDTLEACVREGARKMLDVFDFKHDLFRRWSGYKEEKD